MATTNKTRAYLPDHNLDNNTQGNPNLKAPFWTSTLTLKINSPYTYTEEQINTSPLYRLCTLVHQIKSLCTLTLVHML